MVLDPDNVDGLKEPKGYAHSILAIISVSHERPLRYFSADGSNFVAIQFTKDLNKSANTLRRWDEKSQLELVKLLAGLGVS